MTYMDTKMRDPSRKRLAINNQRGATVIEFAVVVLLLVVILFGILELSFIFLQRHFVANAAREGLRIGIRANNFNCYDLADTSGGCQSVHNPERVYRCVTVKDRLTDCTANPKGYLCTLYEDDMAQVKVEFPEVPEVTTTPIRRKVLRVTVTTPNFFPQLISRIVPAYIQRDTISYTATGDYEDAEEP